MSVSSYLASLPLNEIVRIPGGPPKNAVPFSGYPRQHPTEKDKIILIYDPLGANPAVMEFMAADVLFIEELSQAVTESGTGVPQVKLYLRRGARGVILEPFEVDDPIRFIQKGQDFRDGFFKDIEPVR